MRSTLAMLGLMGCLPGGGATQSVLDPELSPPQITSVELTCTREAGRWRLEVGTDAWSGGGALLWTVDGAYIERHDGLRSVRAGADGDRDLLRLDISIVDDFRGTSNGRSAFTCASTPSAFVSVWDLDGEVSDCRTLGPLAEALAEAPDVPDCGAPWDVDPG